MKIVVKGRLLCKYIVIICLNLVRYCQKEPETFDSNIHEKTLHELSYKCRNEYDNISVLVTRTQEERTKVPRFINP